MNLHTVRHDYFKVFISVVFIQFELLINTDFKQPLYCPASWHTVGVKRYLNGILRFVYGRSKWEREIIITVCFSFSSD